VTLDAPFQLHLPGFDGPLDLLLQLIERRDLDITTISLAQVADLYMGYVRSLQQIDPYDLADFIAVAAKLLLIKSIVLLPVPPRAVESEEVIDPTDLTERLLEYQRIKQAALKLKEREEQGLRSYPRLVPLAPPPAPPRRDAGVAGDLLKALERLAREALKRVPEETVQREQFTIGQKIDLLRQWAKRGARTSFAGLLAVGSRGEIVATFLAVLELLRLGEIEVQQDDRFGEILIAPGPAA
jgi:segregation and condensation protein A